MSTGNPTVDAVLTIVGALTIILSAVASLPGVAGTKAGNVLTKFVAIDVAGLLRLVLSIVLKAPPQLPPKE
jgi:hypothetical protein